MNKICTNRKVIDLRAYVGKAKIIHTLLETA
jgi:hypothetical protein